MSAAASPERRCDVCGGPLAALPSPALGRAMISDGSVVSATLAKASCLACGSGAHLAAVDEVIQRYSFGVDYSLPTAAPAADFDRARGYMDMLSSHAGQPSRVLEMGCGSGRLLTELAAKWPDADLTGVDPALPKNLPDSGRLRFIRGGVDAAPKAHFDLIVSVNVIEHLPQPHDLLRAIAERLSPAGRAIVVCPATHPPNVELLLYDHLFSLTRQALAMLGRQAGLVIEHYAGAPAGVGDFQLMIFRHRQTTAIEAADSAGQASPEALHHARAAYLDAWRRLPDELQARRRPGRPLVMFGAGQMAALLRAYAPERWDDIAFLVMDNPDDAWLLGKAVRSVNAGDLAAADVLIATAPASQARIAARLEGLGLRVIRFDDLISA